MLNPWFSLLTELNLKGNKLSDKRLLKLVDQCHSKQVLDYVRQHCIRSSTGTDSVAAGKGKKSKKAKKELADNDHIQENVRSKENSLPLSMGRSCIHGVCSMLYTVLISICSCLKR
jgi:hypothetical protein